ncbi:MAG: lysophospholipase [Oscillospiraceae bacterium]|jgi:pimeloyl-ACP methyl ester carboxylesterase|nr:lysophospholipase [Oscillospiraceae bacterium]
MMNHSKRVRRLAALQLSLLLAALCVVPAFAKTEKMPLIVVNGMGESPLLLRQGTPEETSAWPPSSKDIALAVLKITPYLPLLALDRDKFQDKAFPVVRDLFDGIAFPPDGTPKNDVGQLKFPDSYAQDKTGKIDSLSHSGTARRYGADAAYQFVSDWRCSALEEAKNLHAFIQKVKRETGYAKVKILAVSMGGGVTMAYLAKYGHKDVDTAVMMHTVFQGLTVVGDLFNGRITLDGASLTRYLSQALEGNDPWRSLLTGLLGGLRQAGLLDWVLNHAEELVESLKTRLYAEALLPSFGQLPGFWGLVPDEDYESGKAFMLDPVLHQDLIKKIDDYHYNVFNRAGEILRAAGKDGVKVYVLSGYGLAPAPVGDHQANQSDDGLPTVGTSGGAVCALLGETLGDGYIQAKADGHNHLSPDGILDASTCLLPEQTWFQKYLHHASFFSDDCVNFLLWLLESPRQLTVRSDPRYPQFLEYASDTGALLPLGGAEALKDAAAPGKDAPGKDSAFPPTGDALLLWPLALLLLAGAGTAVVLRRRRT